MGVNRIQQPWGYQDESRFQSGESQFDNTLNSFFVDAKYDSDTNVVQFYNKNGEESVSLDLSDLRTKGLIKSASYENGYIVMEFSNGDSFKIDVNDLLDINEFEDGLEVNDAGIVSVKIDDDSEEYLTVSSNGIKISGIDAIKDALKAEADRAVAAETALDEKIDNLDSDNIKYENEKVDGVKSVKEMLDRLHEYLDRVNADKAEKEHEHTVADMTDIDIDRSGVVLENEKIDGTVQLTAGQF